MGGSRADVCRGLLALAVLAGSLSPIAAFAQVEGNTAHYVSATYASYYARYYAPYAIQAAAAYVPVSAFDGTRGFLQQPPLDGADVKLAVASLSGDEQTSRAATKHLEAWQYQFGSEGYLTCFESNAECQSAISKDRYTLEISGGPTFQVWARSRAIHKAGAACSEVSIAFRGSTFSVADWVSNLSPVTGYVADDHYRQLRRNIDAILRKIARLDCYRDASTQVVSVGHSLGGGLAQFAAMAQKPGRARISKVFAFDASPVTGASYVDSERRKKNADVEVDLLFQSGEALEPLRGLPRKLRSLVGRKTPPNPCLRTVEFGLFVPGNPVDMHSMPALARGLVGLSNRGNGQSYEVPIAMENCPSRYTAPATDEETGPIVALNRRALPAQAAFVERRKPSRSTEVAQTIGYDNALQAFAGRSKVKAPRGTDVRSAKAARLRNSPGSTSSEAQAAAEHSSLAWLGNERSF